MYSKIRTVIEDYDNDREFERMCGAILIALGYLEVVLVAPRGGNDGGQDVKFTTESGGKGLACVTLRKDIENKFKEDFSQRSAGEFEKYFLFCSTYVTASQKQKFTSFCLNNLQASFVPYDNESLAILLENSDSMRQIRDKYLYGISDGITLDDQQDSILLSYFDRISQLLKEGLRESEPNHPARSVARTLTLMIFPRLDSERKRNILQFLYESGLIEKGKPIVELRGANLSGIDLSHTNLNQANLSGVNLSGKTKLSHINLSGAYLIQAELSSARLNWAKLIHADLRNAYLPDADLSRADLSGANLSNAHCNRAIFIRADLSRANLSGANLCDGTDISNAILREANLSGTHLKYANLEESDLSRANFNGADLSGAFLTGAIVSTEQLEEAKYLRGTTMPDGSINPW